MKIINFLGLLYVVISFGFFLQSCKKENTPDIQTIKYFPRVKAIIGSNCIQCHSSSDPNNWQGRPVDLEGDTNISNHYASIKASIVDPVTIANKRMPQTGSLTQEQKDNIINPDYALEI